MKTTEQNNRMIAEFMGLVESSIPNKYWTKKTEDGFGDGKLIDLEYHTSWDWLMPVVYKIESLGYSVNISRIKVSINHIGSEEEMFSWVCGDPSKKMEILYETLLQFIEWYNQKKD